MMRTNHEVKSICHVWVTPGPHCALCLLSVLLLTDGTFHTSMYICLVCKIKSKGLLSIYDSHWERWSSVLMLTPRRREILIRTLQWRGSPKILLFQPGLFSLQWQTECLLGFTHSTFCPVSWHFMSQTANQFIEKMMGISIDKENNSYLQLWVGADPSSGLRITCCMLLCCALYMLVVGLVTVLSGGCDSVIATIHTNSTNTLDLWDRKSVV